MQIVIGASAVSLGLLLAAYMGGMCLSGAFFARVVAARHHPLRVYALLELGIGLFGLLELFGVPWVGRLYVAGASEGVIGLTAQDADDYRGGWRTEKGEAHTYEFSIRGDKVRGVYCTYCADAMTLAFIDGTLGTNGITFVVTHVNADGSAAYQDQATARFDRGKLIATGISGAPGAGKFERTLIKDSRGPDPLQVIVSILPKAPPVPAVAINQQGVGAPRPRYIQPGPWKSMLTEKDVVGVWLGFGVGAPKQYFIIRKVGNKLRGMVCGTCDNPYTMAALDDFEIQSDTLKFNILHEDWGDGELATFPKHVTCHVGWNELRCTTAADHQPPPPRSLPLGTVSGFSLTGPIAIEATAGNRWPEWPPQNTSVPH